VLKRSPLRFPSWAAGMLSLLVGLWTGLERLGWPLSEARGAHGGPRQASGRRADAGIPSRTGR
jgi:uncharacterized membrane protein YccC